MFVFIYQYQYNPGSAEAKFYPGQSLSRIGVDDHPCHCTGGIDLHRSPRLERYYRSGIKEAEVIELIAQQFAWTARYPGVKDNRTWKS